MKELDFILYNLPEEDGKVQVVVKDETIWATQKAMAELYSINKSGISRHLANIYKERELDKDATVAKIATVVNRGIRGSVEDELEYYNLDAIIAVGYRVNSLRATRFRQWATGVLKDYLRKGFVMDDARLKQGQTLFGKDYFRFVFFLSQGHRHSRAPQAGRQQSCARPMLPFSFTHVPRLSG